MPSKFLKISTEAEKHQLKSKIANENEYMNENLEKEDFIIPPSKKSANK